MRYFHDKSADHDLVVLFPLYKITKFHCDARWNYKCDELKKLIEECDVR